MQVILLQWIFGRQQVCILIYGGYTELATACCSALHISTSVKAVSFNFFEQQFGKVAAYFCVHRLRYSSGHLRAMVRMCR
jgi:hypothetical protein